MPLHTVYPRGVFAGEVWQFCFLSDHFHLSCVCITDADSNVQSLNIRNTFGAFIQRDTQQDGLSLSFPHVCPPPQSQSFGSAGLCDCVCACVSVSGRERRRREGGRKRLTSSVARSDFIPFSLLLVHEHSKNTHGLLSPVCLHTLPSIFSCTWE